MPFSRARVLLAVSLSFLVAAAARGQSAPAAPAAAAAPAEPAVPVFRAPAPEGAETQARAELAAARRALAAKEWAAAEPRFQRAHDLARQAKQDADAAAAAEGLALSGVALKRPDATLADRFALAQRGYLLVADGPALGPVEQALQRYRPVAAARPTASAPKPQPSRPAPRPAPRPEPSRSWNWREPTAMFGTRVGLEYVSVSPSSTPPLSDQHGLLLRVRANSNEYIATSFSLGRAGSGWLYELGFEVHNTFDLGIAYLTFGVGAGIDGHTGPDEGGEFWQPLSGVFPVRAQLMLGEIGFFNLYAQGTASWITAPSRRVPIGEHYLDLAKAREASVEFGIRFSGGLELAARRRFLGTGHIDYFALRYSIL